MCVYMYTVTMFIYSISNIIYIRYVYGVYIYIYNIHNKNRIWLLNYLSRNIIFLWAPHKTNLYNEMNSTREEIRDCIHKY